METRGRTTLALRAALLSFLPLLLPPAATASDPACMDSKAVELRHAGKYEEALQTARTALAACRRLTGVPAWELGEAEHFVAYLEKVASLQGEARKDLERADRLQADFDRASETWQVDEKAKIAKERYELRRKHLDRHDPEVYLSLYGHAAAMRDTGNIQPADDLMLEALALGREIFPGDHPAIAGNLDSIAYGYLATSETEQARAAAVESLEMRRRLFGEEHTDVAASMHTLAHVEYRESRFEESLRLDAGALAMRRKVLGPRHLDVAESLRLYAKAVESLSEWGLAEQALREAVSIRREQLGDGHVLVAEALADLADRLRWQGDLVEARELLAGAIAIQRDVLGPDPRLAESLERLAMLHRFAREPDKAFPLLVETVKIRSKAFGEEDLRTLAARANLALNHAYRGDDETARRIFAEVREFLKRFPPEEPQWAWFKGVLDLYEGRAAEREGDYARAVIFGERVVERFRKRDHPAELADALETLGEYRVGLGELEGAEGSFAEAASVYEIARQKVAPGPKSALFKKTPYEQLALSRLERGRNPEAWSAVEAARARILADLLAAGGRAGTADLRTVPFSLDRIQASLDQRTAIVGWLDSSLNRNTPRSWAYVIRHKGAVRWVRLDLGGDLGELAERLRAFGRALAETGRSPFGGIPAPVREQARALWGSRFAPLEEHLEGVDELVLIPSSAMGGFPVAALIDGDGKFLGERFLMSHAPSSSIHAWLGETPDPARPAHQTALLLGDPPFRPEHLMATSTAGTTAATPSAEPETATLRSALRGDARALERLPRLRWSREEISRISSRFESPTILVGREASEPALASMAQAGELAKYGVIHVATHALIDGEKPERSGLVLSQLDLRDGEETGFGGGHDGIIRGAEILEGWKLNADLVTLSACETALGQAIYGEGVVGLAYPFLNAGARSLLVSLWKVDDRATALFMERFYEAWLGSAAAGGHRAVTKAKALQSAQQWLRSYEEDSGRRPFEHPYYWSAFVLLGDPD